MNETDAITKFYEYIEPVYGKVDILSITEKKERFLVEFVEKGDDFPIDYPIISIKKDNGEVKELYFVNSDDASIIYGE